MDTTRACAPPLAAVRAPAAPSGGRLPAFLIALIAVAAVLARLPFLALPPSSDEGGYLLVASQWAPGSSLYGDYWVDRPPLLIAFFALADRLGGLPALRVLGLLLVLASVLAAAALGAAAAPRPRSARVAVACAATAALFLVNPLFGTTEVNGELIAAPLVLTGVAMLLRGVRARPGQGRTCWLTAAGGAGAAAVLVKQNEWDVALAAAVVLLGARASPSRSSRVADCLAVVAGALLLAAVVLGAAAWRGTPTARLWDAVVVFRWEAATLIGRAAGPATTDRMVDLVLALLLSGAPLLVLLLLRRVRRAAVPGAIDLRWAALALLAWEGFVVVAGGGYWLHYLVYLVPGLVLAVACLQTRAPVVGPGGQLPSGTWTVLGAAALVCLVSIVWTASHSPRGPEPVVTWLQQNTRPGEDAVVVYGQPDVLQAAGLSSPYPQLWTLPARVHDPRLLDLAALLDGPRAPDWVVLTGASMRTWGVDATAGTEALARSYGQVADVDGYTVHRRLERPGVDTAVMPDHARLPDPSPALLDTTMGSPR